MNLLQSRKNDATVCWLEKTVSWKLRSLIIATWFRTSFVCTVVCDVNLPTSGQKRLRYDRGKDSPWRKLIFEWMTEAYSNTTSLNPRSNVSISIEYKYRNLSWKIWGDSSNSPFLDCTQTQKTCSLRFGEFSRRVTCLSVSPHLRSLFFFHFRSLRSIKSEFLTFSNIFDVP